MSLSHSRTDSAFPPMLFYGELEGQSLLASIAVIPEGGSMMPSATWLPTRSVTTVAMPR